MRLPYPKYIPLPATLAFLAAFLVLQLIEGTYPTFALLMLVAQVAGVMAFNRLGGMSHVAGSFCLFSLLPNVTVPEIGHAILGQPGSFNLQAPERTAAVCAVFYVSMYLASVLASSVSHREPYFDRIQFSLLQLRAIGFEAILAAMVIIYGLSGSAENGSARAALQHFLPLMLPLSVMLGTYVRLEMSGGRSAFSWYIALVIVAATFPGLLGASKEGMLTPLMCWLIVCASAGYRFGRASIGILVVVLGLVWIFVYPFSQNARNPMRAAPSMSAAIDIMIDYIRDPSAYAPVEQVSESDVEFGAGSAKLNIIQRYSLLNSNGMLVAADQVQGFSGIEAYVPALYTVIPHFLWPDRPDPVSSNSLGHKAGFRMGAQDTTTGIAIGSPSLFYDLGGWIPLAVYTILLYGSFFHVTRLIVGPTTTSIWGLMLIGTTAMIAGPTMPSTIYYFIFQFSGMLLVLIAVLKAAGYVSEYLFSRPLMQ